MYTFKSTEKVWTIAFLLGPKQIRSLANFTDLKIVLDKDSSEDFSGKVAFVQKFPWYLSARIGLSTMCVTKLGYEVFPSERNHILKKFWFL